MTCKCGTQSNFEDVKEFHVVFDCARSDVPVIPNDEVIWLRFNVLMEEVKELLKEFGVEISDPTLIDDLSVKNYDLSKIAKELSDILYVTYGFACTFGIPIDQVFKAVHASNLSKLDKNGLPIRREDGKILKGPDYREPDIESILK